ncbi:hypothetical protein ACLB2K_012381 [Fragaria x ananassa]
MRLLLCLRPLSTWWRMAVPIINAIPLPNVKGATLAKIIEYLKKQANYLNIKELLDLTCQTVADMIKGKTPEEIRRIFNIRNDFTPEEEAEVRKENQWAFE